jgi:hypothetical protein
MKLFKASVASMDKKYRLFYALAAFVVMCIASCNTAYEYETGTEDYSGVALTGFSLQENEDVLNALDTVFFSIDLNSARVYNADSLPYGTDVSALAVTLSYDACSEATIYEPADEDGGEEISHDYLSEPDSVINFSKGPVRLHLVSYDGTNSRDYTISVNVHKQVPDTLCWGEMVFASLPTSLAHATNQKSVKFGNAAYTLTSDGTNYSMAVSTDIFYGEWSSEMITFPSRVDVRSFTATDDSFYILDTAGNLLKSSDAKTWSNTGYEMTYITAAYGTELLGVKLIDGTYYHVTYPDNGKQTAVAADFPVSGNSLASGFSSKWSTSSQIMTVGGKTATGALTGATWAYDGNSWVHLGSLPAAENFALAPYIISETDTTTWLVTETKVLMAFGGKTSTKINKTVYLSRDYGMTWEEADSLLQLPEMMPTVYQADALVINETLDATTLYAPGRWKNVKLANQPAWARRPRAVTPITEWECPYIYMFGGKNEKGALEPQVWRGVINHLTYKPLQ